MRKEEPTQPDNRKLAFYSELGAMASKAEFRSNFKQIDAWTQMFPGMFDVLDRNLPAVSENSAQRIATVFTCLNVRGETVGALPFSVKKNTDKGPVTDYSNKIQRLIHDRPNPECTAFDFWSTIEKWKLAWGNAYAEIIRDPFFEPSKLELLEPWEMRIKEVGDEYYYEYKTRIIRSTDILHFKNYSLDGYCGVSSIRQNALTMGLALKLNQYNSSIIGERPYGYLTSETRPKDLQQKGNIRAQWDKRGPMSDEADPSAPIKTQSIAGIPYLYGGLEFKSFTLPADDVAYIDSAKLTDQDIYGIFRIPPTFAMNYEKAPYNSSEQQDIVFAKYSLASLKEIEQECTEKLFPESNKRLGRLYCKFNFNGLLRGDTEARKEFYASGIQNAWLTPNQVCEFEDIPTYEGGDKHYIQSATVPIDMLANILMKQPGQTRAEIVKELREKIQPKMNGHWKEIEEFLQ